MTPKRPSVRLVYDRKHQATKSGIKNARKGLVQIEVMYQRKRKYISTGVKVYTDQWRQNQELHVVGSAYADQYNATITNAMRAVMDAINRHDGEFNLDSLNVSTSDTLSVADYARTILVSNVQGTQTHFGHAIKYMVRFAGFSNVRAVTRKEFESFLATLSKLHQTTQSHYASITARVLRHAVVDGLLKEDPTIGIKIPSVKPKQRVRLTDEQLTTLATMEGLTLPQQRARDVFLFQCYTGLSWADLSSLTPDMMVTENGHTYIARRRIKTAVGYRIMLLKPAVGILARYAGTLPIRAYNCYAIELRNLSEKMGVHLTSHVGRHTFATWALSHGTPIEIVSKMLGHTNIKTTQIYAKILAKDVDAQFERLDGLFS